VVIDAPVDAVLIVDSVFGMRPEYDEFWHVRIWPDVTAEVARGVVRDAPAEGHWEAERLHRDRYHASELVYFSEVDPLSTADIVIDNMDLAHPVAVRW